LNDSKITDAGLPSLSALKELQKLHLWRNPGLSKKGTDRLRADLPGVEIDVRDR
jgi:hypothetical protein